MKKRTIKAWVIKCSWDSLVITAFEERNDALEELKKITQ